MLYIEVPVKGNTRWHVGEKLCAYDCEKAVSVQADGDELLYILKRYENIPKVFTGRAVQTWFGDMAKFIAANLT